MQLKGRRVIKFDVKQKDLLDLDVLTSIINSAMGIHALNKTEIDWLIDYKKGIQPVLGKEKAIRDEINNKLVLNYAQMITRKIVGQFLGNPIQYISSGLSDKKNLIDELNVYTQYENKASVDNELGEYQSITGTSYRMVYRDGHFSEHADDDVPFEIRALDPSTTFVVYESNISGKPLLGVTFYEVIDANGKFIGTRYFAYTRYAYYEFLSEENKPLTPENLVQFQNYNVGGIPIIEYPNNMWRIGDWELVVGLMNEINDFTSGRLDDIDQIIQSLLVFVNAEIDSESYTDMREQGVIMLNNTTGVKTEVDILSNSLDQAGMSMFAGELEDMLHALVGIPNRSDTASGGDTGVAIELRDGWADLETICKNKELMFKESEKKALEIMLHIFNLGRTDTLSKLDIEIKFNRNKNNNMLVKTQSYQTLLSGKTLSPDDCLTIVDLVSDPVEHIERGKTFWGEKFGNPQIDSKDEKQLDLTKNNGMGE